MESITKKYKKKMNKRGQMKNLIPGVALLTVSIIVLVLGLVMIQEMRDTDLVTNVNSQSVSNETVANVAGANAVRTLDGASFTSPSCSLGIVTNSSNGVIITSTNFTQNNCQLTELPGIFNESNWNVSYSLTFGDEAFISGNTSLVGLGGFADFVPIIVIALAASIIIGLILVGFAFNRRRR